MLFVFRVRLAGLVCALALCGDVRPSAAASAPATAVRAGRVDIVPPEQIRALMRRTTDYQFHLGGAASDARPDPNWTRAVFYTGVLATYYATGDERYRERALRYATEEGRWTISTGRVAGEMQTKRHADRQAIAQVYLELHLLAPEARMIRDVREAFDEMIAAPAPGRELWWWSDALFMAPPALSRLHAATGERKYLQLLDALYADATDHLYDRQEHLYFRDGNYFRPRTAHGKKIFWSRGNGWVLAGLARTLEYLPAEHLMRARYEALFRDLSARVIELQRDDGFWRASLLDPEAAPGRESSGTAFFTFALAWGVNRGVLDRSSGGETAARRGWDALTACVSPHGRLGYVQPYGREPKSARADDTFAFGVGALLHAGLEMITLNGGRPAIEPPGATRK